MDSQASYQIYSINILMLVLYLNCDVSLNVLRSAILTKSIIIILMVLEEHKTFLSV